MELKQGNAASEILLKVYNCQVEYYSSVYTHWNLENCEHNKSPRGYNREVVKITSSAIELHVAA